MADLNTECLLSDVREWNCILPVCRWLLLGEARPSSASLLLLPALGFFSVFQSLTIFSSTSTETAEPSHRAILSPAQPVLQTVYVMHWTSSKKKKKLTRSKATFQSKHAAHDWRHLAQGKICTSSRPGGLTEAPTSLSGSRPPDGLGADLISPPNPTVSLWFESSM